MTFADYWAALQERNPGLVEVVDCKMSLPVVSFKKCLEQAYNAGREQGAKSRGKLDDLLSGMFGGGK